MVHPFSFVRGTTNMKINHNIILIQTFFLIQNLIEFLFLECCQIFAKSDGEPIEKFKNRDKADAEGDSSDAPDIGGEIKPGHLFRS